MKLHSLVNGICLGTSIACLGLAYILAEYWQIIFGFLIMMLAWLRLKKSSIFWSASSLLLAYVLLAAIGVIVNVSTLLIVLGCTAALACWDLTIFAHGITGNPSTKGSSRLENIHLKSLGTAASLGLISARVSSYIELNIPFAAVMSLVLIAVGCLVFGLQLTRQ